MKGKNVFFALGLALTMGLGVGAALIHTSTQVKKADAYSGAECGTTWYITGTIGGSSFGTWHQLVLNGNRYEYTFEDASTVKFKLKNVNSWSSGIEINAGYGEDLDWSGKGWTALTEDDGSSDHNFQTRAAGKYTVYFDKNISGYENGIWAFGIEEYVEKTDPSTTKKTYYVHDPDEVLGDSENLANVNVYGFGQAAIINEMDWPGVHSNSFASVTSFTLGRTSVYKVELSESFTKMIVNCGNGNNQTDDIEDLTHHIGDVVVIGGLKSGKTYNVSWVAATNYTDCPATDGYYIVGTASDPAWSFTGATKLDAGDEDNYAKKMQYTVANGESFKVKKFEDGLVQWFGINGDLSDAGNYTNSSGDSKKVNVYASKDGKLYVEDYVAPDVPAEDGYYLASSKSAHKYAGATKMSEVVVMEGGVAELYGYEGTAGETVKVRAYFEDTSTDKWSMYVGGSKSYGDVDGSGNFEFSANKTIDIFAYWDGDDLKFTVDEHRAPTVEINGEVLSSTALALYDKGDYDAQYKATITVAAGDELNFKLGGAAMSPAPTNNETNHHNVYVPTNKIITGGTVDVYLQLSGSTWKYFVSGRSSNIYVYTDSTLHAMVVNPSNSNEYMITNLDLTAGKTVQIYETTAPANPAKVYKAPAVDDCFSVVSSVVNVVKSGTYNLYYNIDSTSEDYHQLALTGLSAADVAADAFIDTFLATLSTGESHVCNGDATVYGDLRTAWGNLQTAFNNIATDPDVKADAQDILKTVVVTQEGKRGEFARLYDFIMNKYKNRTEMPDFALRTASNPGTNAITIFGGSSNTVVLVTMISVIVVITSAALFFYIKKRREN